MTNSIYLDDMKIVPLKRDDYNRKQKRLLIEQKLKDESSMVAEDSQSVLCEFETIDYAD